MINNKSVTKTNILIYRFSTRYVKHVTLRRPLRTVGVGFPTPGSYPVFKTINCSLWTCSKSLMPYSIQFINNYTFLLHPLPGPAFLFFFLSSTSEKGKYSATTCMWNIKIIQMNINAKQKQTHRYRSQTSGYQWQDGRGKDKIKVWI